MTDGSRAAGWSRRALLSTAATAALAGCTVGYRGRDVASDGGSDGVPVEQLVALGTPSDVCAEPVDPGGIRPVVDPAFGPDWDGLEYDPKYDALGDERVVVGLTDGDRARAYPVDVLWYHEAVNDSFGGPVLVTYCSICRSGLVAVREAGGEPATFAASGLLWQPPGEYTAASELDGTTFGATSTNPDARVRNSGNVVLYDDATGSYWSQLLARAICGPLAGARLDVVPSTVATWGDWRREHPETRVLLPPPYSTLG